MNVTILGYHIFNVGNPKGIQSGLRSFRSCLSAISMMSSLFVYSSLSTAQGPCHVGWVSENAGGIPGLNGQVRALLVLPNGDLVAGGDFTVAGNVAASKVARWNQASNTWSNMGEGLNETVWSLGLAPNGDVLAGGTFWQSGTNMTPSLALWSDVTQTWSPVVQIGGDVYAVQFLENGDLVVGGFFYYIQDQPIQRIARRVNSSWLACGWPLVTAHRFIDFAAVPTFPGGFVAATSAATADAEYEDKIHFWNGSQWVPLGTGTTGQRGSVINCVFALNDGSIIASGNFLQIGGIAAHRVARYSNGSWAQYGTGMVYGAQDITTTNDGLLIAAGYFLDADGLMDIGIGMLTNTSSGLSWESISQVSEGGGVNGYPSKLATLPNGDFVLGGQFTSAGGQTATNIVRWSNRANCATCDSVDFNNDTSLFDPQDIESFLSVYSEGPCIPSTATCNDIDFNNDGSIFDPCDIDSFLLVYSEGPCTPCGT